MANLVKHRFVSPKTDGPDATQIRPSNWNDGHVFSGGAAGDVLTRDPTDATYGAKWASPLATVGIWADIPFSAANFGTDGSGSTWTIAAGDVTTYGYAIVNRLMFVSFFVGGSIAGAPTTNVYMGGLPFPAIRTVNKSILAVAGTVVPGVLSVVAGNSFIKIFRSDGPAFPVGTISLAGQIMIPF